MRFEFFKILDSKYVNDLRSGRLYMNSLEFFRKLEGNSAQNDWAEGVCGTIDKRQLKQFGYHFPDNLLAVMGDKVPLQSNYYGLNNIFCLYRLLIDDEKMLIQKPDQKLLEFNDVDCDSKVVVHITDTDEFLRRLDEAADKLLREHKIEYSIYGNVAYESQWTNADGPGARCAFHKEPSYSYQREWRFCILQYVLNGAPFVFEMGDLTEITEVISLKQFLSEPESLYPGYTAVEANFGEPEPVFKTAGMIDAVSHLMFSYTDLVGKRPVRSDTAQADWHYAQYLKLSDREAEIDDFLETQMKKYRDLDHMELLVEHRLAVGAWVKSTDAFMYFINEVPSEIEKDPGRFFFQLHSILMRNREAIDAAKLFVLADKDYQLPEDLKEVMFIDILFANGFYDKVVPVLKNRQLTSPDPVLADAIRHISQMKQVKIVSPELISYLAMDLKDEDMPGFYKMEQAKHMEDRVGSERVLRHE